MKHFTVPASAGGYGAAPAATFGAVPMASSQQRIFGREVELGAMRAELGAAMQGGGRLVLVSGEPGIGKTTLVCAHAAEAKARGALVLWGRCHETEGAPPYWPWLQVLEALDRFSGELPEPTADALRSLRDELRAEARRPLPDPSGGATPFELFARFARTLSEIAEKRGLVVAIDDLHWADGASLRLLQFLASELSSDAILLIATLRSHEPSSDEAITSLARLSRTLPLGPLDRGNVADLLAERVPATGGDGVDREALVSEVWDRSEGNPFFVLELAQLLVADRARESGAVAVRGTGIEKVLARRIEALPEATRRLLRAASVVGRGFDLSLVARMLGEHRDRQGAALRPALDAGLVKRCCAAAAVPGGYAFAHALSREALYASLAESEAEELHAAAGAALESQEPPPGPATLAHHFLSAGSNADPDKAIRYGLAAGEQMLAGFACEEAIAWFERAAARLTACGDPQLLLRAELGLGQALLNAGNRERAESVLDTAVARSRPTGDAAGFGRAVLAWCAAREEIGVLDATSNERLEEALERLHKEPTVLRARLLARLSSGLHLQPGAEGRRDALGEEALGLARALGDPATLSFVQVRNMASLMGPDQLATRRVAIDEMLADAREPSSALNALSFRIDACAESGDRRELDATLAQYEQRAEEAHHPIFAWNRSSYRTAIALLEGRFGDAERHAVEGLALGQHVQDRTPMLQFAQQMFMLRGWQDRLDEVAPLVQGGADTTAVVPAWRCALADLYEMLGRHEDAKRELDAVACDDFESIPRDTTWLTAMVLLASLCCRRGERAHAALLYERLLPYTGRAAIASPMVVVVSSVDMRLGQLAALLGRNDDATAHFAAARRVAEHMRALPWRAEIDFYEAEMLLASGGAEDRARGEALLSAARETAEAVGMALLVRWIDALTTAPASVEAAAAPPPSRGEAIFRQEGELWTLVFEGRTTRMRPMVGLAHLHRLLADAGCEQRALDLVSAARSHGSTPPEGEALPALDDRARREYRLRVQELEEALEEARRNNDCGRAECVRHEIETLRAELSRGFGLGGRRRCTGSTNERARVSVTRAIRYAIRKIAEQDAALAEHLQRDVRTGSYCSYRPSERDPISWTL